MQILRSILFATLLFSTFNNSAFAQKDQKEKQTFVEIETDLGKIKVKLYNKTPKHRDNFIKLVEEGFYDGTLFHRVIANFMIQGGDPDSKNAVKGQVLGQGSPGYQIDAEFDTAFIHKKGALAAARTGDAGNPEKKSSGSQFYIAQGKTYTDAELDGFEQQKLQGIKNKCFTEILEQPENARVKRMVDGYVKVGNQRELQFIMASIQPAVEKMIEERGSKFYSPAQRAAYKEIGGTPHLDGAYTVFGEIVEGLDVLDKIADLKVNPSGNRPVEDVSMKMKIVKR